MSRPGRKPHLIPRVRWDVYIRTDLAAEVELLIADPMREKAKYGARTNYLESLVVKDLAERRKHGVGAHMAVPSELERMIHALEFELASFNLGTPEKIKEIVNRFKPQGV